MYTNGKTQISRNVLWHFALNHGLPFVVPKDRERTNKAMTKPWMENQSRQWKTIRLEELITSPAESAMLRLGIIILLKMQ